MEMSALDLKTNRRGGGFRGKAETVSLLLFYKILELLLIMAMGYAIVKGHILKADDSIVLSKVALYIISPAIILYAFQVDFTPNVRQGILFSTLVALVVHAMYLLINRIIMATLGFDVVERMSIIYSNAGNLIIPIVMSILGPEWLIYSIAFMAIQIVFFWTHCKFQFCQEESFDWRTMMTNINLIAIAFGALSMVFGIHYPKEINDVLGNVGNMIGPVCMLVTGMIVGGMNVKAILGRLGVYKVALFRLIIMPALFLALFKISNLASLVNDGDKILLITFLAIATPSASTVVQFAQVYGGDAEYAGAINIVTLLLCIISMPIFVYVYYL